MLSDTRIGRFTSSTISDLLTRDRKGTGFGATALSLIAEKRMERRLKRGLGTDMSNKACNWGTLVEQRVATFLEFGYEYQSSVTVIHPEINEFAGTADAISEDTVGEIKCPFTLKSFCELVDAMNDGVDALKDHKIGIKYYWQIVSNAAINNKEYGELFVYCPYQSELDEIRYMASNQDESQHRFLFIAAGEDAELPYILDGGYYQNLNRLRFQIQEADKALLIDSIIKAVALL